MTTEVRVRLDFAYHEAQREIAQSDARFKVVAAGRRFGKTRLGIRKSIEQAVKGGRAWWVAPTYSMAMEGWRPLETVCSKLPGVEVRRADHHARFPGGGMIEVKSADHPHRMRGAGIDFVVVDEAAYIVDLEVLWEQVLRPALADRKGSALLISTPKGLDSYFHQLWLREDWESFQYPTASNPHIDPDEIQAARVELGSLVFSQEFMAEFVALAGTLFRSDWLRYATSKVKDGLLWLETDRTVDYRECERFATVDLAASTKETADYTVIASCAAHKGQLIVLEVVRRRLEGPDIVPAIRAQVEKHDLGVVHIEKAGFQLALIQEARRDGLPVKELRPDRDKVARALPLQARMEAGDVWFVEGPWLPDLERELLGFPATAHDDQVDALAYAARVMVGAKSRPAVVGSAAFEATGLGGRNEWSI